MEIRQIRQYQFHERLGQGVHGESWLAMDAAAQRPVVVKFLAPSLVADETFRREFLHRIERISKLPGQAAYYGLDTENDRPFLVRQYVDGRAISEYGRVRPIDYRQFLELACQLTRVVSRAHLLEIPLLNLTPENVLVNSKGQIQLTDMCLPWNPVDQPDSRLARAAAYRSPEQLRESDDSGDEIDIQSDIFSLGAILYGLLTGKPAFGGDSLLEVERLVKAGAFDIEAAETGRMSTDMHLLLPDLLAVDAGARMSITTLQASLEGMLSYFIQQPGLEIPPVKSGASQRYMQIAVLVALVIIFSLVVSGFYR
jgi:serine/threonine-protein kinase